jgi:hypothetical protein
MQLELELSRELRESPELTVGRIRARKETVINPLPRYEL